MSSSLSLPYRRDDKPECELSKAVIRVEVAAFSEYWKQKLRCFILHDFIIFFSEPLFMKGDELIY